MANEVRYTTSFSFADNGLTLNPTNTVNYSITGSGIAQATVMNIGSGQNRAMDIGDCPDLKYLFLKNQLTGSGIAIISTNAAQTQQFARLAALDSLVLPPVGTGIWISGQAGPVEVQVVGTAS